MTSARKHKLRIPAPKPRNPLVPAAAQRKAGEHRKSHASQRQQGKRELAKELKNG